MSFDPDDFITKLSALTVGELVELEAALEATWGVAATPAIVPPTTVTPPPPPPPPADEVTVTLTSGGANRVAVIRVVRELLGLGLVEARDLVDAAPKMLKAGVSQAEAQLLKTRLVEVGAEVELR